MFFLIRLIIWLAGVGVITYFGLGFLGYEVNTHYWQEQKADCQQKLEQCKDDLIKTGVEGAKKTCELRCVNPKLLIKKPAPNTPVNGTDTANQ